MTPSRVTLIGPRAIASNPMYHRHPSNLSCRGARDGRPWPSDFGVAQPSDILRTSTADPLGGSTPHYAPSTAFTDKLIPTDPSRHPSLESHASSSHRRSGGTGSPQHCSIA